MPCFLSFVAKIQSFTGIKVRNTLKNAVVVKKTAWRTLHYTHHGNALQVQGIKVTSVVFAIHIACPYALSS